MRGIVKGSIFSLILILILSAIAAFINMKISVPQSVLKGILWILSGICVFAGVLPVTKSATDRRLFRGIACSFLTVLIMMIILSITGKGLPLTGAFYAYGLICMLCGLLGSLIGINI